MRSANDPLSWLLEHDADNPGVRYFALRDMVGLPPDSADLVAAQEAVMASGPVPAILAEQHPDGYWIQPGYLPKYNGTMWSIIFLAQLGANGDDPRIQRACEHLFDYAVAEHGGLSADGRNSGLIHCLQGNLCAALLDLGYLDDERLQRALDWLARSITGEGIAPNSQKDRPVHYLRSGNSAPGFECSANNHSPCAWGAVKALLALSKVPPSRRTAAMDAALETGIDFLFSCDPATAAYPMGYTSKPNRSWFKFGYPLGYVTDVLQILEVLTGLGYGADPRLANALDLLLRKQDKNGRWRLEYSYNGKTWVDVEEKGKPSKWVTLRALRVLARSAAASAIAT
ncbi:MAG: nitrogen fixation protein NifH [Anaerolineae bacterium]|nr:nitrogen fixation protein NifH [Anaerolineae bacterium]